MNKAIILGNLGQKPDIRALNDGKAVGSFSVATNKTWKDKDGKEQSKVEWHRVTVWGKTAENCGKYLDKGSKVLVEGELQTREWEDKDKIKRYTTEIVAHNVQFVGTPGGGGARAPHPADGGAEAGGSAPPPAAPSTDEIPF